MTNMNQDQIKQFESLAKPLMEWLKEHGASGTVVMTSENCQFLKSEITIERQFNFYDDPDNYVDELVLKNVFIEKQNPVNIRACDNCFLGVDKLCSKNDICDKKNNFPFFKPLPF